ncbi:MAG: heat-inducible transcriptional repressor HrcA [Acidobacteriota bacterium]|nr:heat-inducible transcriptional repressor HrcA [Acidobacteriota bacterium]MDH3786464.1 heat-inducible transcriptional repressor HrcA [Acidobacteriota bacterium]
MSGEKIDERESEILKSVIRAHIASGDPVGSQTVAAGASLRLSPASIRNIMADLEERGFLSQPHPSAGRVPTDQAYRLYVDQLISTPTISDRETLRIDKALDAGERDVDKLLLEVSRQLSSGADGVGLVLVPNLQRMVVEHLEFVRLDTQRIVAILVGRSGVVHNRILEVRTPLSQPELDRIGSYLSEQFGGRTLPQMRSRLRTRIAEQQAPDADTAAGLELGQRAVAVDEADGDVIVEGGSRLLAAPEFADLDVARSLFRTLEEKNQLVDLLSRLLGEDGVQVVIGNENPVDDLARCSLVAANYLSGDRVMGTLGIVGPTRMQYVRAIALVDYLARALSMRLDRRDD